MSEKSLELLQEKELLRALAHRCVINLEQVVEKIGILLRSESKPSLHDIDELYRQIFAVKDALKFASDNPQSLIDSGWCKSLLKRTSVILYGIGVMAGVDVTPIVDEESNGAQEKVWTKLRGWAIVGDVLQDSVSTFEEKESAVATNECERNILQALNEYGDLKGEDLAARAGYDFTGHFKGTLSSLRKRELIANERGRGYYIPESQD